MPVPRGFAGRKPRLYCLTDFGLRYLRQQPAAADRRPFRPRRDRKSPLFVPHDLEVAALWANLQPLLATGQLTHCRWVPERLLRGRKLRIQEADTGMWLPVVPDAYVELRYPDGAVQCCMVEIDRGTHTLDAFARKLRAFEAYYSSGQFTRHGQRPAFEVLVLTHSVQRLEDLWAVSRAVVPAHAWSWYSFTTFDVLAPARFSGPVWRTLEDRRGSLLYAAELAPAGGCAGATEQSISLAWWGRAALHQKGGSVGSSRLFAVPAHRDAALCLGRSSWRWPNGRSGRRPDPGGADRRSQRGGDRASAPAAGARVGVPVPVDRTGGAAGRAGNGKPSRDATVLGAYRWRARPVTRPTGAWPSGRRVTSTLAGAAREAEQP